MTAALRSPSPDAKVTLTTDREIHIERIFNAPRARVWRAITEPAQVAQWWGRGHKIDIERLELRRGGHWRFVEHTPSGPAGFEGRYREVTPPERLVLTFEWDGMPGHVAISTTILEDLGDRTRLVGMMQFFTTAERDGMIQAGMERGMNESYRALDAVLDAMSD